MKLRLATVLLSALAAACDDGRRVAALPSPASLDREAIGHYCRMIVADHPGPKAQLFLGDRAQPVWFSSVRDAIAFTRLPEEPKNVVAIYVNDMTEAPWERPGDATWIEARRAWFVLDSARVGGMGAPEAVPFATEAAAETFVAAHGGHLARLDTIPDGYVLGAVTTPQARAVGTPPTAGAHAVDHAPGSVPH